MYAIVVKELRENLRWLPVGILIIGVFLWLVTPTSFRFASYSNADNITQSCAMGAALFAIVLSALQSVFDLSDRQRGYLFHRSVSTNAVMYGKVIAGAILYAVACAIPLICSALWFAWMGLQYLPFRPAQLIPSIVMCVACFFLHPATLISVDRPARWFGTKLLPLIAVAGPLLVFWEFVRDGNTPAWWLVFALYLLLFTASLLALQPRHWTRKLLLVVGSAVTAVVCFALSVGLYESTKFRPTQGVYSQIGLDDSGQPWYYRCKSVRKANSYSYETIAISGAPIRSDQKPNLDAALPSDLKLLELSHMAGGRMGLSLNRFASIEYSGQSNNQTMYYDSRGLMLVYDSDWQQPPLSGVISQDGFHPLGEAPGARFSSNPISFGSQISRPLSDAAYSNLWADADGVYQFTPESGAVTTLLKMTVDAGTSISPSDRVAPQLLLLSDGKFHQFELVDEAGGANWFEPVSTNRNYSIARHLPPLKLQEVATFRAVPKPIGEFSSIAATAEGKYVALDYPNSLVATLDSSDAAEWQVTHFIPPDKQSRGLGVVLLAAIVPSGLYFVLLMSIVVDNVVAGRAPLLKLDAVLPSADLLWVMIVVAVLAALALAACTYLLCRRRGLTRGAAMLWTIATLFLGLATPLAVIAIFPKLVCEPCPGCQRPRRVDREKCPHCAAPWSPPPAAGIELIEGQALATHMDLHPV